MKVRSRSARARSFPPTSLIECRRPARSSHQTGSGSQRLDPVGAERRIAGHDDGIETSCLSDEHSIERIPKVGRKTAGSFGICECDRDRPKSRRLDRFDEAIRGVELPDRALDLDLPDARGKLSRMPAGAAWVDRGMIRT